MLHVTLKGLMAHKIRLATTAIAVLIGVAFMAGTLVLTATIGSTFDGLYADINAGTDVVVRSSDAVSSGQGFETRGAIDESVLPLVRDVPGVRVADGNVSGYAQYVGRDGKAVGNPNRGAPTLGFAWSDDDALNPLNLASGNPPSGPDQLVMDKATADDQHFTVGDQVTVLTQSGSHQFTISGIARFGDVDSPLGATLAVFDTATAQQVLGLEGRFTDIAVAADEGVSQQELAGRVQDVLPPGTEAVTGKDLTAEQQKETRNALSFLNTFLLVFAVVALFVGSFLIYNTFSIIVAQRSREMALLRAVGAARRQVLGSVMAEALITGVVASAVGVVVGFGVAVLLKGLFSALGIDIPASGLTIEPNAVIVPILVGVVITVASAWFPARRASKVPPIAAMRDVQVDESGRSVVRLVIGALVLAFGLLQLFVGLFAKPDNALAVVGGGAVFTFLGVAVLGPVIAAPVARVIGWPIQKARGMSGVLARENSVRNPKRTSATAAALMIGVGLVAFILIFWASATDSIRGTVDKGFVGDFAVQSNAGLQGGLSPEVATQLRALPESGVVSEVRVTPAEVDGSGTVVPGVDPSNFSAIADVDVRSGSIDDLSRNGTLAVWDQTADDKGWSVGDTVPVLFPSTGEQQLQVVATYHDQNIAGGSYLLGLPTYEANTEVQLDWGIYVKLASGVSADQGRAAIESVTDQYPNAQVQNKTEFADSIVGQVTQLLVLVIILLLLAVVIALIGIANTLALSIFERTHELGLLRAVGMTRNQLRSTVRWESVIIALLGTFLGLVIGLFFGWALVRALADQGFGGLTLPIGWLVVVVVVAFGAGVVAAIFPARRASRLDVLRAIQTE
jgi:putative ABC transport system permease protein